MNLNFDDSNEAFKDLPEALQELLNRYSETGEERELDAVITAVLKDLGSDVENSSLSDQTNFIEDLGLDSLAIAEFVFFFEDIFKIKITNEALSKITTLGGLKRFLAFELS